MLTLQCLQHNSVKPKQLLWSMKTDATNPINQFKLKTKAQKAVLCSRSFISLPLPPHQDYHDWFIFSMTFLHSTL